MDHDYEKHSATLTTFAAQKMVFLVCMAYGIHRVPSCRRRNFKKFHQIFQTKLRFADTYLLPYTKKKVRTTKCPNLNIFHIKPLPISSIPKSRHSSRNENHSPSRSHIFDANPHPQMPKQGVEASI